MKKVTIALLVLSFISMSATATVLSVPDSYGTMQAGIDAASNGDTVLVADGVYQGEGNCALDFNGKSIVVMSENGPGNCTIVCDDQAQGFIFNSGETSEAVLRGVTITCGSALYGGGIRITDASPTIERCIIWGNNAYQGGGIYVNNGDPHIVNCTVLQNTATNGGAIYLVDSDLVVNSCIVAQNTASG